MALPLRPQSLIPVILILVSFSQRTSLWLFTNGAQRFVVSPNGNVGIGNLAPDTFATNAQNLVIGDLVSDSNGLTIVAASTKDCGVYFADGTATGESDAGSIVYEHSVDNLIVSTDGSEALRVDNQGRVGIGSTAPQKLLHVKSGVSGISGSVANSSGIVIENGINDNSSIEFQCYPNTKASIIFGDSDNPTVGSIEYDHAPTFCYSLQQENNKPLSISMVR